MVWTASVLWDLPVYISSKIHEWIQNKNCILYVGVKDDSVVKEAIWLENLHIILPEYKDMFHYELTRYFMSRTLPIK